jgi:hypothetical protein
MVGIGAAFNNLLPLPPLSHPFSNGLSLFASGIWLGFSVGPEACDCLSQVESDEPLGIKEMSSSFGNVEVDAVPKLGEEVPESVFFESAAGAEALPFELESCSGVDSVLSMVSTIPVTEGELSRLTDETDV